MVRSTLIEVPIKEVFKMFITVVKKGLACCLIAQVVLAGIVRAENEMTDSVAEADSLTSTVAKAPVNTPQYLMRGIEVVGDKVGRDIQDLPTSAAVVDESRMEDEPIATIDDVLNRVANVNSEGMAAMGGLFSIRGINQGSIFASFDATNQLAAVYLNQVALGGLLSQYIKPSTWDVRSVEVLRGPQSTLQGKNSLAGAVFFNYNRPDFTFDGGFRAEYGELDTWNLALYQNVPIEDDVLAARIALETRNSDGGIVNPITGADDIALIDEKTARLQLLYQPFGNEDISFNLTGIYFDSETNTQPRATEFGMYDLEDRLNEETWPGYVPQESWFTALESDFRLDDNWRIAAVTGYSDLKITGYKYDGDQMAPDLLWVNGDFDESQFSQDLRLHYEGGRFRGLLGGYYSKADVRTVYDADGFFTSIFDLGEEVTVAALYANADYDILDNLTLNAGLRYNTENRKNNSSFYYFGPPPFSTDPFAPYEEKEGSVDVDADYDQLLPSASLTVKFTDDVSAGLKYAKGYRSGGIAVAPFLQIVEEYEEEIASTYELFFRSVLLDDRLTLNGNIFFIDWQDMQVPYLPAGGFPGFDELTANAGKTEIKGFEVEARAAVTDALETFLALGHTSSEFKEFELYGEDLAGRSLPNSPEWTVAVGANYNHSSGFFAGGTFRWVDESYSVLNDEEVTRLSIRHVLDAKAGYRKDNWSVYVWGTNLLDDFYELNMTNIMGYIGMPGRAGSVSTPRRLGVGVEATW